MTFSDPKSGQAGWAPARKRTWQVNNASAAGIGEPREIRTEVMKPAVSITFHLVFPPE